MKKSFFSIFIALFFLFALAPTAMNAQENGVVHAVFFFSPTCPHCHEVINNVLPPLNEQYGEAFSLLAVNTTRAEGSQLYNRAVSHFQIPQNRRGVPTMIVGNRVLVGSQEIPDELPGLIEAGLAAGGVSLPPVTGMETAVSDDLTGQAEPSDGFGLAWLVLLGLLGSLGFAGWRFSRAWPQLQRKQTLPLSNSWLLPALIAAGILVAGYLTYVDLTQTAAVCGPFGECDLVQNSVYAHIVGIPVAVLGLVAYLGLGGLWLLRNGRFASQTSLAALIIAVGGTLFSIYLTLLELFVIEAVCAWCLASAIIIGVITIIVAQTLPAKRPLRSPQKRRRYRHS